MVCYLEMHVLPTAFTYPCVIATLTTECLVVFDASSTSVFIHCSLVTTKANDLRELVYVHVA